MPREIYPSSYECDCGHQSHFFENTIREAKALSQRRKVLLGDSETEEHTIVFYKGRRIDILCPQPIIRKPKTPPSKSRKGQQTTQKV